jgi:hypothetical protein
LLTVPLEAFLYPYLIISYSAGFGRKNVWDLTAFCGLVCLNCRAMILLAATPAICGEKCDSKYFGAKYEVEGPAPRLASDAVVSSGVVRRCVGGVS